jgi:regulator of protease activity HflC (stomatin/prohibitin superfamily)
MGNLLFNDLSLLCLVKQWQARIIYLRLVPGFVLVPFFFVFRGWRYFSFILLILLGALLFSARYVKEVYGLPTFKTALRYLIACLFGEWYPNLDVEDGEMKVSPGEFNLLKEIGGPGVLTVKPGNVVLLERLETPSRVCGHGKHFVSRYERIAEIIDLNDQQGFVEHVTATTKDGLQITIRDINYRYRLRLGRGIGDYAQRTKDEPYPYSIRAVRNMAYNRAARLSSDGDGKTELVPWDQSIMSAVKGVITDYIRDNVFDDIMAPGFHDKDPKAEIKDNFESPSFRSRLNNLGAELLWVDIGHFDVTNKEVKRQRIKTWGVKWAGEADVIRAIGEAQHVTHRDMVRAEAQAEMLISIIEALNQVLKLDDRNNNKEDLKRKHIKNIIITQIARILEAMTERGEEASHLPLEKSELPPPSPPKSE